MNRNPFPFLVHALLLPASLSATLPAQTIPEGYTAVVHALPGGASYPAVLPNGIAWWTGTELLWQEQGQPVRRLLSYPSYQFGGFAMPVDPATLLFADSGPGQVWLVPTPPGTQPTLLTSITLAYDATALSPTQVIVSARTGGFGAQDNDLLLLDLTSGAVTWLGNVPGASGPVTLDAQGGLLYATAPLAFPAPPGTVQILRWSHTQLIAAMVGALPLSAGNAQLLFSGLDAAGDLVLDGDDDLLFTDWMTLRIGELNDVHGLAWRTDLLDYAGSAISAASLQFVPGATAFEPFAPATGGALIVHETDYAAVSQLRTIVPARPSIAALPAGVVPAGPLQLTVQAGPRHGLGLFVLSLAPASAPLTIPVPGFEQALSWNTALLGGATTLVAFDATGTARLQLVNPGFAPGLQVLAANAFLDAGGTVLGSTDLLPLAIGN